MNGIARLASTEFKIELGKATSVEALVSEARDQLTVNDLRRESALRHHIRRIIRCLHGCQMLYQDDDDDDDDDDDE